MKNRNGDLENLLNAFDSVKHITGRKFIIPVLRNKQLMKDEIALLQEIKKEDEEFTKLKELIQTKQMEYADKDEDGNPKLEAITMPNGTPGQKILMSKANETKLSKELKELEVDNKKLIETHNAKEVEYFKSLGDECKIKFNIIKVDDLPEELTLEQIELLDFMIDLK